MASQGELGALFAHRILDCENYFPLSKEQEHLELFTNGKIFERIPGLTWESFRKLTPAQTASVLAVTAVVGQKVEREQANQKKQLDMLSQEANKMVAKGVPGR